MASHFKSSDQFFACLPVCRVTVIALFVICSQLLSAQSPVPSAVWLLPGVSWRPAKDIRLSGQLGYNHYLRSGIFYPQAFITVHKHVILNPAYIYAVQKKTKGFPTVQEHYLMNAVIFQTGRNNFTVDDRNMIWNRLTVGNKARHYYRNRLRITQSFKTWRTTTKLYGYNEIFYLFNNRNLVRNRVAIGISCDLGSHTNLDLTCIRQWDRYAGKLNLFFLTGIWQF